jgi:uncharacterized protein (TIGR02246 family)
MVLVSCSRPDPAEVTKTITGLTAEMEKEMLAGTIDTAMSRYADDCVSLPNFGPRLKGKQAMLKYYLQMNEMGMKVTHCDFNVIDVKVDRTYAFELGEYTMTVEMPGMPAMPDTGKYLTVWQLESDGSWKIKVETWNTNKMPPMPGMEEGPPMGEPGKMPEKKMKG